MRILILVIFCSLICISHINAQKDSFVVRTEFENQGDQEDYWAKKFFHENYKKKKISRFDGIVQVINNLTFEFDKAIIILLNDAKELDSLFSQGVLYPQLFISNPTSTDTLKIDGVEELKFLKLPHTTKRFRLWVYNKGFLNPTVYLFEMTNDNSSTTTDLKTFLNGASLTFFREGWLII